MCAFCFYLERQTVANTVTALTMHSMERGRTSNSLATAETQRLPSINGKSKAVQIPRIFWYACSYGVFVITTGIGYMAFHATTSSLEAFGAKLELGRALEREAQVLETTEQLAAALKVKPEPFNPAAGMSRPSPVPPPTEVPPPVKIEQWKAQHQQQQQQFRVPQQQQQQGKQ